MNEFIILNKENYTLILPLDVVAFHYSDLGACGRPGVIRIITKDKRKYENDYTELPPEIVFSISPPLLRYLKLLQMIILHPSDGCG